MKILIVAPNASARFGGEAFLPLKYFEGLARRGHAVRLVTHARVRDELAATFPDLMDRIDWVQDTRAHRVSVAAAGRLPGRLRDVVLGLTVGPLTDAAARRLIAARVAAGEVEVIHQPQPVSPRAPSAIHGFGVPVVIGPMNGDMRFPRGWEAREPALSRRLTPLLRLAATVSNRLVPGKARAAVLLVANDRTRRALPVAHPNVETLVENGVDFRTFAPCPLVPRAPGDPFRLVFLGRLVGWKAVDVTLAALAQARAAGVPAELDILGDGEARAALQAQAAPLGAAVRFHGFVPQAQAAAVLAQSHALILNSLWECGGAVVLEAMATGLPVIASAWGGPADYLDASCGILVDPAPAASFADRLAQAIARLAADPAAAAAMGAAGAARARAEFDWDRKIDRIEAVYARALRQAGRSSGTPSAG
ncbi:MAG: glycosyltransferase family 4 protein [Rhodobacterales bacterium]|nr:glycosyltransferase family 4 protein [Rhodobacterales bacterium]